MEVSVRVFAVMFEHLPAVGSSVEEFCEGMPFTVEQLRDPRGTMPWEHLVAALERLPEVVGEGEALTDYVKDDFNYVSNSTFLELFRSAVAVGELYRFLTWSQRSFFPFFEAEFEEIDPDHVRIRHNIPEDLLWPEIAWTITAAVCEGLPRVLDLPDARVRILGEGRQRTVDIMLPATMGLWQRLKRGRHAFMRRPGAVAFVIAQQEEVERRYAELKAEMRRREEAEEELRQAQKLEVLGQLAGGIAHDFNNLLAVILGSLELLSAGSEITEGQQQLLDDAIRAVTSGRSLTSSLLAFSRKAPPMSREVDVRSVIVRMAPLLARALPSSVELVRVLDDAPVCVTLDPGLLQNAVLNLVVNANQAMQGHGVITLRLERDDDNLILSVEDDGPGMSEEIRAAATEPFFTTKPHGVGTGLGLAMVKRFTEDSGGALILESPEGGGAAVRLRFPVAASSAPVASPPREIAPEGAGERVLLLDDSAPVRQVTERILRRLGYEVVSVGDAEGALEALDESIDLLLSDVVLGGERSGVDVAREARARRPKLAVLMMTGYAPLEVGVPPEQAVLGKPFTAEALSRAVRLALSER